MSVGDEGIGEAVAVAEINGAMGVSDVNEARGVVVDEATG